MTKYRYVVVSGDGRSWLLQGDKQYDHNIDQNCVLPKLLEDGWKPVRERSLTDGSALVLMKPAGPDLDEGMPF